MIRPLRKAHLRIWIALAIVLPIVFVSALAARRTTTPVNAGFQWERFK